MTRRAKVGARPERVVSPDDEAKTERLCVVSRVHLPQKELLRFVPGPLGHWVEDLSGRLPGRGVYVVPSARNIRMLFKRQRGGGAEGVDEVLARLGPALTRRCLEGLGLARRSGALQRGVREVAELMQQGRRPLLLLATDTATHTREELEKITRKYALPAVLELLDRQRFGMIWGGGDVAVLAVTDRSMANRVRVDVKRWQTFFAVGAEGSVA